ncbi:hypothetical protein KAH37_06270 [bacterium]|nr:hypothetical protein [bacterium]
MYRIRVVTASLLMLLFLSCSSFPVGNLTVSSTDGWHKESFEVGSKAPSYHSSGDITLWIDNARYKGKVNGHFELFHNGNSWRMDITGPFNVAVATLIVNGKETAVFAEGKWLYEPWDVITKNLFGSPFPPLLFNILAGSKEKFEGLCSESGQRKVCTADGIYFLYDKTGKTLLEFAVGDLSAVLKKGKWYLSNHSKKTLLFNEKTFNELKKIDATLFQPGDTKDELDDI